MPNLTDPLAALELLNALLPKTADTLTVEPENASHTKKTSVSTHADTLLTPADTPLPVSASVSTPSAFMLTQENPVQDANTPPSVSTSAHFGERAKHPHRDPDPSGCPLHWQRLPLLPEKGSRVALLTADGYGAVYRFKHAGAWYVLKFLPPFDGRLSLRNEQGQTWVFPSLNDLARYLGALEEVTDELADDDDVVII